MTDETPPHAAWVVFTHHLPARPSYLRVKISRRLEDVGAQPLKSSVYVLPRTDETLEDFQWILREVVEGGGAGHLFEARFLAGVSDDAVTALFQKDRESRYHAVAVAARGLLRRRAGARVRPHEARTAAAVRRLRKRLDDLVAIDFFGAAGRQTAEALLLELEVQVKGTHAAPSVERLAPPRARVWVTRTGIKVDRMASAWLIRRFVDPEARFKFVPAKGYVPGAGELRFDMFEGDFTHEGDLCTFEVLRARFGLEDPGLVPIAEMVHDIDLKDGKYGRPERPGVETALHGIALACPADEDRLTHAGVLLDGIYEQFRRPLPGVDGSPSRGRRRRGRRPGA